MRTSLTLFCILIATITGFCQDKSFDLSKYKFPDYKRHELELNFNSSGSSNSYYSFIQPTTNNSERKYDRFNSNFDSRINVGYQFVNFTRNRIDQITTNLIGSYQYLKSEDSGEYTKQSEPNVNYIFQASRRNYLTEDKVFIEGLSYFSFDTYKRKVTYDSGVNTDISTSNYLTISLGIGIGTGRIERVNDLWQGYYILEKLKQQNSLSRELKEQDIFEFASFISKLKNKRFFDFRLRKIAELQSLDSILYKQSLIDHSDISYFTTLNDYWSFPIYFDRKSGRELKFQLTPEYRSQYYKSNDAHAFTPAITNLVSKVLFDCSKQLNLFWERNVHIDMINITLLTKNGDVSGNNPGNLIGSNVSFGYGFFPDSRTRLLGSVKYQGGQLASSMDSVNSKYWFNSFSLNFEVNYYISPQLQITGNLRSNYGFADYNSTHSHNTNYNLGLRYAIF